MGGSTAEVKEVIGDRRISSCLAQLQKLDLPREKRRRINRKFVVCLAAGQAKAFAQLKKLAKKETKQVIDDFTHSPSSCTGILSNNIEDLKESMEKKYHATSFTCTCDKAAVAIAVTNNSSANQDHNLSQMVGAQNSSG